jgi:ubiquinone/menaquinone biosynthesis C-methylase UbiE
LDILNKKAEKNNLTIKAVQGDVVDLPFEDNSFDAILAYHSVYHVNSHGMDNVILNIERVLKPGGEVYITLISKNTWSFSANSPSVKVVDENVRLKEEQDGNFLPHFYVNYQDILKLFKNFEIIRVRQIEDIFDGKSSWHYFVHIRLSDKT